MLRPGVDAFASSDVAPVHDSRLLAAHLLERNLLRLGRAGTLVDRRLAPGLERLRSRRLYRPLGYVRLGDYLTERLGMSLRRCQAILRLERVVESLPRLALALQAGEISLSKLETLAGVATTATEAFWLERARRLSVAGLREATRAERPGGAAAGTLAPARDGAPPKSEPVTPAVQIIEQDEPGRILSFIAPASVLGVWYWTLNLVRRVAGRQEPAWRCVEYLAAEFLSGVPEVSPDDVPAASTPEEDCPPGDGEQGAVPANAAAEPVALNDAVPPDPAALETPPAGAVGHDGPKSHSARADRNGMGMTVWGRACDALREALASIGAPAGIEALLSAPPEARGDDELDAWELDALLRRLVRLRQSLAWRQGHLLEAFASSRLYHDLGFGSLDDWIGDRLPMSPRRARYLISLDRRLHGLPLVTDAYRRGLLSWCQTRILVRVVAPGTQSRWIRYARRVTVRRLEEAVIACELESAESARRAGAAAPAHIGAPPLPPSDPLPGDLARTAAAPAPLHTSALDRSGDAPGFDALHTSAPLPGGGAHFAPTDPHAWRRISFWAPLDVASLWESALRACRADSGPHLADWECFLRFVDALRETWENPDDPWWKRRHEIFERDGWRCRAPGCSSRSGLNEHHIIFRSQQGSDDAGNLVTLCIGHHQQGIHEGRIRCFGRAPDALWWDLGIRAGGEPLLRYFGDRLVARRPPVRSDAPPVVSSRTTATDAASPITRAIDAEAVDGGGWRSVG